MSKFYETKLGAICEIFTGFPFKGNMYSEQGSLPVLRGENVTIGNLRWDTRKYWNHDVENLSIYFLKENDVVIGMDGSRVGRNRAAIRSTDLPMILAQRVARLRAKEGFSQKLLKYLIMDKSFVEYVDAIHTGTSIPHISPKQIFDFEVQLPVSLIQQERIAEVLSSLDDKIDLLHRNNKTLEQLAETLFRQWFVEEAEDASGYHLCLEEIVDTVSYTHKFKKGGAVFLNTSDIYEGAILTNLFVNKEILPGQAKKSIQKGDILFSEIRPSNGRWAYVDFIADDYVVSTKLMVIRSKGRVRSEFIYFYLTLKSTVDYLQMIAESRSGTFPQITFDQIKPLVIKIPSETILKEAEEWCISALQKILFNKKQIQKLETLRDTLLPKLMSGVVRVEE